MRRATLGRKRGLGVEWARDEAIERWPTASRRHQCSAAPPPQEGTRERELPLLSKAAVTTEVTTEPDEDVKKSD